MDNGSYPGRPVGEEGRLMLERMNEHHEPLAVWGFGSVDVRDGDACLDIGCGGGVNVERMLSMNPSGHVTGLDHSEVSVDSTLERNEEAVEQGRCTVLRGDVMDMPFEDSSFDVVTAFETVYFWPDLTEAFREVRRVLRDGGSFTICNEDDGLMESYEEAIARIGDIRFYTAEQLLDPLLEAGFIRTEVRADRDRHWLAVRAWKRRHGRLLCMRGVIARSWIRCPRGSPG